MTRHTALLLTAVSLTVTVPAGQSGQTLPRVNLVRVPNGGIQPQAAMDAQGTAHLLYFQGEAARGDLFYVRLDRRGNFSRPLQVNSQAGNVLATGTVRGGHIAIGRNGRVHVAWVGSAAARPKVGDSSPVLYTRLNDARTAFEPERNVVSEAVGLDGDAVAADDAGRVYVAWHAAPPGGKGEAERRVWVAASSDDGRTFAPQVAASDRSTGACGCCGVGALADAKAGLFLLYRSAADSVHRDTYLLVSRDRSASFTSTKLQEWNVAACPMSTYALSRSASGILGAWETDAQVYWIRMDASTATYSAVRSAPGGAKNRKHPAVAANSRGEVLLVWAESTGWNKGGSVAWQLFDKNGTAMGDPGGAPGLPVWSIPAVAPQADGGFTIIY